MTSSDKPNIVFIVTDEQRADSLGCYASQWASTPNIDEIASSGVVFDEAITPAPVCVPARTSMLSGRYPSETGCFSNADLDGGDTTDLVAPFAAAGYTTASFGKQHYRGSDHQHLFQQQEDIVLSDLVDYTQFNGELDPNEHGALKYPSPYTNWLLGGCFPGDAEETAEARIAAKAREFVETSKRPFFMRLSFNAPHTPVVPPARFLDHIDSSLIDIPTCSSNEVESFPRWLRYYVHEYAGSFRLTESQIAYMRHCYYAQVAFVDHLVGQVIESLEEHRLLEDTIIVYVSDHGTHLGDHCLVQKQSFYDPVVRVPFIVRYPGRLSVGRRSEPVSTTSVLPTLMELVGIDIPNELETRSIAALLSRPETQDTPTAVFSEFTLESIKRWGLDYPHKLVMVREGDWKLCYTPSDPSEGQLFNMTDDPLEVHNRYAQLRDSTLVRDLVSRYEQM